MLLRIELPSNSLSAQVVSLLSVKKFILQLDSVEMEDLLLSELRDSYACINDFLIDPDFRRQSFEFFINLLEHIWTQVLDRGVVSASFVLRLDRHQLQLCLAIIYCCLLKIPFSSKFQWMAVSDDLVARIHGVIRIALIIVRN